MATVEVSLPPINQPIIDRATGLVTEPWYRYFETIRNRTGGDVDLVEGASSLATSAEGKATTASEQASAVSEVASDADANARLARQRADTAVQTTEGLAAALAATDTELSEQGLTLADHEERIILLEAAVFP